jgi:hypothetical protein
MYRWSCRFSFGKVLCSNLSQGTRYHVIIGIAPSVINYCYLPNTFRFSVHLQFTIRQGYQKQKHAQENAESQNEKKNYHSSVHSLVSDIVAKQLPKKGIHGVTSQKMRDWHGDLSALLHLCVCTQNACSCGHWGWTSPRDTPCYVTVVVRAGQALHTSRWREVCKQQ